MKGVRNVQKELLLFPQLFRNERRVSKRPANSASHRKEIPRDIIYFVSLIRHTERAAQDNVTTPSEYGSAAIDCIWHLQKLKKKRDI